MSAILLNIFSIFPAYAGMILMMTLNAILQEIFLCQYVAHAIASHIGLNVNMPDYAHIAMKMMLSFHQDVLKHILD